LSANKALHPVVCGKERQDPSVAMAEQSQDAVFAFLGDPSTHGGKDVRRIDTHAAVVFLAGDRALKVKRAVRFPFLDYSTLEKRRAACLAELEVNRPFAAPIYRGVVPITRHSRGRLSLDGNGEPVEWAVDMLRFDEGKTLDRLAETGGIDDQLPAKLAVAVQRMHAQAPQMPAGPWLVAVERFIEQNTAAFQSVPDQFREDMVDGLHHASLSALDRLRPLLLARGTLGFVRRGHGDLHLGNIVLLKGEPMPFDAIEFDPAIATGDVLYDLAFLLMDLVERKLDQAANIVLNGYFARTRGLEDYDGLAALPLFMSLRAAIRAKVTAARIEHANPAEQAAVRASAKAYFSLAVDLLSPSRPTLVAVGGLSGTGKSSLARTLAPFVAPAPGAIVVRSDVERKYLFGVDETEHLAADAYRPEATRKVYEISRDKAARIVAAGHSSIVDAVFAKPEERVEIAQSASLAQVAFHGLFLTADLKTRLERVGSRGPDASDADAAIARQQESYDLGALDWTTIDASGSLPDTLSRARKAIV
jgi:uncharacterized protein